MYLTFEIGALWDLWIRSLGNPALISRKWLYSLLHTIGFLWPSYLYNGNHYTRKDNLYIETGPRNPEVPHTQYQQLTSEWTLVPGPLGPLYHQWELHWQRYQSPRAHFTDHISWFVVQIWWNFASFQFDSVSPGRYKSLDPQRRHSCRDSDKIL